MKLPWEKNQDYCDMNSRDLGTSALIPMKQKNNISD